MTHFARVLTALLVPGLGLYPLALCLAGQGGQAQGEFVSNKDLLTTLAMDLRELSAYERQRARYLTLTHLHNQGEDAAAIGGYRAELMMVLQEVSDKSPTSVPFVLGRFGTVLRVDLGALGWAEDRWERLLARYPYGVHHTRLPIAAEVYAATGSELPLIRGDWFAWYMRESEGIDRAPALCGYLEQKVVLAAVAGEVGVPEEVLEDLQQLAMPLYKEMQAQGGWPRSEFRVKFAGIVDGLRLGQMVGPAARVPAGWEVVAWPQDRSGLAPKARDPKTGITFILVDTGRFMMGSPDVEGELDEHPRHAVSIAQPFYLAETELTQAQWEVVMGGNPSHFKNPNKPVEMVSWQDAQEFVKKAGPGYRLPSEAEWEYACRAGSTTMWCFGDAESTLGQYAWYGESYSGGSTNDVGQKRPNAWGLFDMHGNVWEWCADDWHDSYRGAPADGGAWETGAGERVIRGGGFSDAGASTRSAFRYYGPSIAFRLLGLRPAVGITPDLRMSRVVRPVVWELEGWEVVEGSRDRSGLAAKVRDPQTGITFILVEAGSFMMGSPAGEGEMDEHPLHEVRIAEPFYLAETELTQAQWERVIGGNPSHYAGTNKPVETVSWADAQTFMKKAGPGYRLPSEAEWEYACRAGSTTTWCFGDSDPTLGQYAWYGEGYERGSTHDVGQRKPNAWGFWDMHGNVWEWCADDWHDSYQGAPPDGSAWVTGAVDRVIRGGGFSDPGASVRSAFRYYGPAIAFRLIGLRPAVGITPD